MQNFIEIQQRDLELLSLGGLPPPPRLDRGMRLDGVKRTIQDESDLGPSETSYS